MIKERTQLYAELAANAFRGHVCKKHSSLFPVEADTDAEFGIWYCGNKSGSNIYRFRVIHVPWLLWCGGDVGDCEWRREYDMISWASGCIDSVDYFFSKVPYHIKREEFSPEKAKAWVDSLLYDEFDSIGYELHDDLSRVADNEFEFTETWHNSDLSDREFPPVYDYPSDFYWGRECIKWFLANCKELR